MKLNVIERLLIPGLLPEKGTFANVKLLRVARENLSFTDAENKALEFKPNGDKVTWNDGAVGDCEIAIGEVVTQMIVKKLNELEKAEDLPDNHISVYEKFIYPPLKEA